MNQKINFLYAVIVALLLLNTGTLAFIFLHHPPPPARNPQQEISRWLTEQLQLNAEQEKQYKVLQDEHRQKMDFIHQQDRDLHDRYFQLLNGETVDSSLVNQLADSIAENRKQTELTTFYDFKKIRAICNGEQQKKFDAIIGKALKTMGRPPRR